MYLNSSGGKLNQVKGGFEPPHLESPAAAAAAAAHTFSAIMILFDHVITCYCKVQDTVSNRHKRANGIL